MLASGTVSISADAVSVNVGRFSGVDPAFLNLTATGELVIQGGSTSSGVATVAANTVNITASNFVIQGGSSTGSYAGIIGGTGSSRGTVVNNITLAPGAGVDADALIGTTGGSLLVFASSCIGCTVLASDPLANQAIDGGLFGAPVNLVLPGFVQPSGLPAIEIDTSIIYAATLAESGGAANTSYSDEDEGEKQGVKEEGKNDGKPKRSLPMCI